MRIYVVRHGQTIHNVDRRIQGPLIDDPLNDHGMLQADALERRFARHFDEGLRLDAIYASPLKRAWMTAESLARGARIDTITPIRELQEFSWGAYLGEREEDVRDGLKTAHEKWASGDLDYAAPEGESPRVAWARLQAALAPVLARHFPALDAKPAAERAAEFDRADAAAPDSGAMLNGHVPTIALVAHGRINKILLSGLVDDDLTRMEAYPQGNTSVTLLENAPSANGGRRKWVVRELNDQSHLEGDAADAIPSKGTDTPLV